MINQLEKLSEYIQRPLEERMMHIDLSTACDCRGKRPPKADILDFLNLEDDVTNWNNARICRPHICQNDSKNGWCRNPLHYILGTCAENMKELTPTGLGYNAGKGVYKDPDSGETAQLTMEEAEERGWVGVNAGTGLYMNPSTGETARLTKEEAEECGWVGHAAGRGAYKDPQTGETALLTKEEAEERGWVGSTAGLTMYKDPGSGKTAQLTKEEALERGWEGVCTGKAAYKNPSTGEVAHISREEAEERGWVGVCAGKGMYRDPLTGEVSRLTKEEAEKRGWVGVTAGCRPEKKECPHCGTFAAPGPFSKFHGDNCVEHEGSWRWFKAQLKQWSANQSNHNRVS